MEKYLCPVCERFHFERPGDYEICPVCGWENDKVQAEDPDFEGGANALSLNQARNKFMEESYEETVSDYTDSSDDVLI